MGRIEGQHPNNDLSIEFFASKVTAAT